MVRIEVLVPSARVSLASKISGSWARICDEEAIGEKRHNAEEKQLSYQRSPELTTTE